VQLAAARPETCDHEHPKSYRRFKFGVAMSRRVGYFGHARDISPSKRPAEPVFGREVDSNCGYVRFDGFGTAPRGDSDGVEERPGGETPGREKPSGTAARFRRFQVAHNRIFSPLLLEKTVWRLVNRA
jgi:hypothetical protein